MGRDYSGTPPYGQLVITPPPPPFLFAAWQNGHTFFL